MILTPATKDDAFYFYQLRIDPVASRMSRRRAPTWAEHMEWWDRTKDYRFVGYATYRKVGTIRLALDGTVSIIVDPIFRGMGYGTEMLRALDSHARSAGITHMLAEIAPENVPSQQAFTKAGWSPVLFEKYL